MQGSLDFNDSTQPCHTKSCTSAPIRTEWFSSTGRLVIPCRPSRIALVNSGIAWAMLQTTPMPVIATGEKRSAISLFAQGVPVQEIDESAEVSDAMQFRSWYFQA